MREGVLKRLFCNFFTFFFESHPVETSTTDVFLSRLKVPLEAANTTTTVAGRAGKIPDCSFVTSSILRPGTQHNGGVQRARLSPDTLAVDELLHPHQLCKLRMH